MTANQHLEQIRILAGQLNRPIRIMEVCGTHTMTAFRAGLRALLPDTISLLSGPGCPVCVTPIAWIDRAIAIARQPNVIVATFGDLIRVPGTVSSLEQERARGAQVRIVYSPADALAKAGQQPDRTVVFLGIGFETTAPTVAWCITQAQQRGIANFRVLSAHKTMPFAMAALLQGGDLRLDGFLCPGHVSAIIGLEPYRFISRDYRIPCVVTGFESADMLAGIEMILRQVVDRRAAVENQYTRGVPEAGNADALAMLREVFEECDAEWRGLGTIPRSGLRLRERYRSQDADALFDNLALPTPVEPRGCRCGDVLRGTCTPPDCPLFRASCTPATPVGACMVSSEGACAAYFKYHAAQSSIAAKAPRRQGKATARDRI